MSYMYHVPYVDERSKMAQLTTVYTDRFLKLPEVVRKFFIDSSYGFNDEDYLDHSDEDLLEIAVQDFRISRIEIHHMKEWKMTRGNWDVEELYHDLRRSREIREHINSKNEILISSHVLYGQVPINGDDIFINVNGVEKFLFTYSTPEEDEEGAVYETFETGIHNRWYDEIEIQKPIVTKEEVLDLCYLWADLVNLEMEGKTIRFSNPEEFQSRPIMEEVVERNKQDPNHIFSIPSKYMFGLLGVKVPPKEELSKQLNQEKPGTIACVIDRLKDETILYLVQSIENEEKRNKVIELLPQVPSKSLKERLRYAKLFHYDPIIVKKRMEKLQASYQIAVTKTEETRSDVEEDIIAEFEFWKKIR